MPPAPGENGLVTINRAFYISAAIGAVASIILAFVYLPGSFGDLAQRERPVRLRPTGRRLGRGGHRHRARLDHPQPHRLLHRHRLPARQDVGRTSLTGAATVILSGLSVGFESGRSTPALVIGAAVFGAFLIGSGSVGIALFAVALAGCGLLTTVGVIVAMDTFGPVSDNAQGIAEMSGDVDADGAQILTELDAVGNTTKAITKGHRDRDRRAGGERAVRLLRRRGAHQSPADVNLTERPGELTQLAFSFDISHPNILVGALLGAATVFLFAGLAINAVGRPPVGRVRGARQFREIPGIMEGTGRPEYGRVVDIVTRDSCARRRHARPARGARADRGGLRSRRRPAGWFLAGRSPPAR